MGDFCPSELNSDERKIRNIVMEKAIRDMYGKSMDEVYEDYFKPAIEAYIESLKHGQDPNTSKLGKAIHDKTIEINERFVSELHSYMCKTTNWKNKNLPVLSKSSFDIIVMCESCHFHTFYTSIFKDCYKDNERFKVLRINFQLANIGSADRLTYVDGKYTPMSNSSALEIHRYTRAVHDITKENSINSRLPAKSLKSIFNNTLRNYSTSHLTSENYKIGIDIYQIRNGKNKLVNVYLTKYNDDKTAVEFNVPIMSRALAGVDWK